MLRELRRCLPMRAWTRAKQNNAETATTGCSGEPLSGRPLHPQPVFIIKRKIPSELVGFSIVYLSKAELTREIEDYNVFTVDNLTYV